MHKHNVVHRDIKPENLFVTESLGVKIGDFGISRSLPESFQGKGCGNTIRVRNYMRKSQISGDTLLRDPKTRDQFISYIKKTVTQNRKKRR